MQRAGMAAQQGARRSRTTPWSPLDLGSKLTLWRRGDAGVTLVSGAVSAHADQSGNERDYTQGTVANRPALGAIGSLAAIDYDGANDRLVSAATTAQVLTTGSAAGEVLIVAEADAVSADQGDSHWNEAPLWAESAGFHAITWSSSGIRAAFYSGSAYSRTTRIAASTGGGNPHLVHVTIGGGALTCRVDDGSSQTASMALAAIGQTGGTWREGANYAASAFFNGRIGELIVCNAALSDSERSSARAYLAARWGVSV